MSQRRELEIGRRLGPYVIIRQIGKGGMGEVYEAYEDRLHRRVALKVVSTSEDLGDRDDVVRRFIVEARALAKIYHPNIVTVHAIDNLDGVRFIAMEYVEGTSLRRVLDHFIWTAYDVSSMFLQALEALRCLHENGILHRDIKPQNLMLRPDGQIKILDLGIAKVVGNEIQNTAPGAFVGTVNYMAPEVAGGADATAQSDIWSLGAIYYETLVGKRLVPNADKGNLLAALEMVSKIECEFTGEAAARVPKSVQEFVRKLCARDPRDRYKNASEAIEDLKKRAVGRTSLDPSLCSAVVNEIERIDKERELGREVRIEHMLLKGYPKVAGRYVIGAELPVEPVAAIMAPTLTNVVATFEDFSTPSQSQRFDPSESWTQNKTSKEKRLLAAGMALGGIAIAIMIFIVIAVGSRNASQSPKTPVPRDSFGHSVKDDAKFHDGIRLESPSNMESVWLNPTDVPMFSWSEKLSGTHFIEISTSVDFSRPFVSEMVSGKSYRLGRSLPEGEYHWRLIEKNRSRPVIGSNRFYIIHSSAPELLQPKPFATFPSSDSTGAKVQIEWKCKPGQRTYHLQIVADRQIDEPIFDTILSACSLPSTPFTPGSYTWRVRTEGSPIAEWSRTQTFKVEAALDVPKVNVAQTDSRTQMPSRKPALPNRVQESPSRTVAPSVASPASVVTKSNVDNSSPVPREDLVRVSLAFNGNISGREPASVIRRHLKNPPRLTWNPVAGAKGYFVQIATDSDFNQTLHEETVTSSNFLWRSVRPGRFHWRVCALSRPGPCQKFGASARIEAMVPPPNLPPSFTLSKRGGLSTVDMGWNPVPLSERYIVQASPNRRFASISSELITSKPSASLSLRDSSAKYVRVAVLGPDNSPSSAFSAPARITAANALATPTLTSPLPGARFMSKEGNAKTIVVFSWNEVANANEYLIEIAQDSRFTKVLKRQVSKSTRMIMKETLEPGELHWRVRARKNKDLSDWGDPASFVIQGGE